MRICQNRFGISNVIVVMLSLVILVTIVANVILWSYQMNQLDWERMRENINIANVIPLTSSSWFVAQDEYTVNEGSYISGSYTDTQAVDNRYEQFGEALEPRAYYPDGYNIVSGTYISGSVPSSVQTVDTNYFIVRSSETVNSTTAYNPSDFNLLGSTQYVYGSLTDLQSDNNVYMTFRSYVSATSTTAKTNAFIAYRDSTTSLNIPKERTWTGESVAWGGQTAMPDAGSPVRWVRVAYCPLQQRSYEKIVVTLSDDRYYDAYVWNGTSWLVTNNIGFHIGTTFYRGFDVAYEKTSGRALLVYSRGTTTNEIGYRIWNGIAWSAESVLDLPYTTGVVYWIALATAPGTRLGTADDNEIAMIYLDANVFVHGYVWTGSEWSLMGATAVWDTTAAIATEECIAVAYEQLSGRAMFIWGDIVSTDNYHRIWDGTTLSGPTLAPDITTQGAVTNWVTLKANPSNNELMYLVVDGASDLNTAYWSGSAWTIHAEHDGTVDTHAQRCADFAWEPTGSKGLLVWGTTAGQISYKTFTVPNTWGTRQNPTMGAYIHPWVQLRTNTRNTAGDVKILGAVLEGTVFDLGAIKWDGATFTVIGTSTFTADTTVVTFECFELEFGLFGDPTEFTSEVEFTGTSNTESWTQLVWTVDSSFTTTSVTTIFQLYNYQSGSYPTSGDGYMTDTIGTSDVIKTQTITTNPTYFRDVSGNWKIKVKGVKSTATQFDFRADWIEFKPTFSSEYTVSTEFTFSSMMTNTPSQLNFTVVSQYDVASVSVTIQVWNYSSSTYVTSGEGYLTYTSAEANETKLLSINTNPQFYTSAGNAKIKITGVLTTTTQYQQEINQVKLDYQVGNRLDINGVYVIDLSKYPLAYIQTVEIQLGYRASDGGEKWYLKAYNWTAMTYSDIGFNSTTGHTPTTAWDYYVVNLTTSWSSYVWNNGTIYVKIVDEGPDSVRTTIDIDFLGVKAVIEEALFTFKNRGPLTSRLVSLWIINSTHHQRYDIDVVVNSGETLHYSRDDIDLPSGQFIVKVVTERGNIAVFSGG